MVGPHRTGTSATTQVISKMGASLGDGPLMPGDEHEYYENIALAQAQHKFFEALGGTWDSPVLPRGWDTSGVARIANGQIKRILDQDYSENKIYVLKSTLMPLLRPLWKGIDLTVVKTFRSQWETMESLQKMFRWDKSKALEVSSLYLRGQANWPADWKVEFRDLWDQEKMEDLKEALSLPKLAFLWDQERELVHFGPIP